MTWCCQSIYGYISGTTAMDLSRAFDRMPHGLLIAKLDVYCLSDDSCNMVTNYLKNRHQRVKVMGEFSYCTTINCGVPQGSVMGPLLFNIFWTICFMSIWIVILPIMLTIIIYTMQIAARLLWKTLLKLTLGHPLLGLKINTRMSTLTNFKA